MASLTSLSVSTTPNFLCLLPLSFSSSSLITLKNPIRRKRSRNSLTYASSSSSSSSLSSSSKPDHSPPTPTKKNTSNSFVESTVVSSPNLNYALPNPNGNSGNHPLRQFARSTEANIEKIIFDFRFLALFAIGGSLAGSLLCFLNGCVYIFDAYKVYMSCCMKGVHTGQMVLRLVEAIDVYLAGTVMFIFAMGLYGLFISNVSNDEPTNDDRAFKGSSLFGMFALKSRPSWMNISSLDELKTKVGHVIVMILLVKMFERSKMVTIATGLDLLSYSVCIFLSAASLYILHNLHKSD